MNGKNYNKKGITNMHIDGLTLLVMSLLLSTLFSCGWFLSAFVFKASPKTSIQYALSNMFLGGFMLFYILRDLLPDNITYTVADISLLVGFFFLHRAIQEFTQKVKRDKMQICLVAISTSCVLMSYLHEHGQKLAVVSVCMYSFYAIIFSAKDAYDYIIKDFKKKYCLLVLSPLYWMATLIFMRMILTIVMDGTNTDLRHGTVFNMVLLIAMLLALLGFNVTAIGLVISRMITQIRVLSQEDPLTKTYNRRHLTQLAEQEINKVHKTGMTLSIIMLDIDHFKKVNDQYGHAAGDAALITCVETIKRTVRATDYVGRLGGEEFCIMLPNTEVKAAQGLAERIRLNLEKETVLWQDKKISITASFGVAALTSEGKNEWSNLLNKADVAMYEAKNSGRNKVVMT